MKTVLVISALILAVVPTGALWAETYYVSPNVPDIGRTATPIAATWEAAKSISSPCDVMTAFKSAKAGDVVLFLGGTYKVPQKNFGSIYDGYYNTVNSGTQGNPIVFKAHPGATPVFDGTAGGSGDLTSATQTPPNASIATIFGTKHSWITFDGFVFQADNGTRMGRVMIGRSYADGPILENVAVKNCVFNGGSPIPTDYHVDTCDGLRIESAHDVTVSNCRLYNYVTASTGHIATAFKSYRSKNIVFENCEIYGCDGGLFFKSSSPDSVVRNCYIHDNGKGIMVTPNVMAMVMDGLSFHNNLFVNQKEENIYWPGSGTDAGTHGNDFKIYNNTVYKGGGSYGLVYMGFTQPGHGTEFYNNIVIGTANQSPLRTGGDSSGSANRLKAADHNQWGITSWGTNGGFDLRDYGSRARYRTLAAWQGSEELENPIDVGGGSSKHPGYGDLGSDPQFVNASGSYSKITDFLLAANSPCRGAGRSGQDMGALVSLVGLSSYTVTSPNGGETWPVGSRATVTWTSTGNPGNVDIGLSTDGGATWTKLAANTANDGSETVTVPNTPSAPCRVRVGQTAGGSLYDDSNAAFTIGVVTTQGAAPDAPSVTAVVAAANPEVTKNAYSGPQGTQKAWELEIASGADGKDPVFISKPVTSGNMVTVAAATGVFKGTLIGRTALVAGKTYYCRVRQQSTADVWSDWSTWHKPFTAP